MESALHSIPSSNFAFAGRLMSVLLLVTMQNGNSSSDRSAFGRNLIHLLSRPAVAATLLVLALSYMAFMLVGLKSRD